MIAVRTWLDGRDRLNMSFTFAAVATAIVLLALGWGTTFFHDEWQFIDRRGGWDLRILLAPHNEHWSTVPVLIYKLLLETVGLRTYLPYQIVVVVLHVLVAAALFRLIRHEAGPLLAFSGAGLFLVLGTGNESLLWPALIGWNAAAAAGGWALALTLDDPRVQRPLIVAALLLIAVASSGVGLIFLTVVGLALLLTTERRRHLWVLLPAIVAYAAWYLAIGRAAVGPNVLSPDNLSDVPAYVVTGFGNAMGRLSGWGDMPGVVLAVVLTVATVWRLLGPRPVLVGAMLGIAGVLVQFAITGLARISVGVEQAHSPRYVYVAAFFILIALGSWLGALRIGRNRPRSVAALGALLAVALAANLWALYVARGAFLERAEHTRAAITVLTRFAGSPAVPADGGLFPIPAPARLDQLFERYGSPLEDVLGGAREPSAAALDRALFEIVSDSLTSAPAEVPDPVTGSVAPTAETATDLAVVLEGPCLLLTPAGPDPQLVLTQEGGLTLIVHAAAGTEVQVFLAIYDGFQEAASRTFPVPVAMPIGITLPDLGTGSIWRVRLDPPAAGPGSVCLAQPGTEV